MHQSLITYAANNIFHNGIQMKTGIDRHIVGTNILREKSDSNIHDALHFDIIKTRNCSKSQMAWTFALA